jgi:hypothetical protein
VGGVYGMSDGTRDTTGSAHGRAPSYIGGLCDLLLTGMKQHIPNTDAKAGKNWCTIGKPGVAFVQHTRNALNVFLRCDAADGAQLSSLLDPDAGLSLSKRQSLGSEWAKSTPYFLRITTPEEATAAALLLLFLARRPSRRQSRLVIVMPSEDGTTDHWEGNCAVIYTNRFERDPKARANCIKIFGASCSVCTFDFGREYGKIGEGFIHVHHLKPLSAVGASHKVSARNDLRPVCPNCHEMLHKRSPPFSIEELRDIRNRSGAE